MFTSSVARHSALLMSLLDAFIAMRLFSNFWRFSNRGRFYSNLGSIEPHRQFDDYCITYADVATAHDIIKPFVHYTPLVSCTSIDDVCEKNIFMKTENLQKTGSFKFRGAINAITSLIAEGETPACIVTHSSGNHGQAIAKAAQALRIPAYVIVPSNCPECKKEGVRRYGGIVIECHPTEEARIVTAEATCKDKGGHFIHTNQATKVIAATGTLAVEMLQQNPDLDAIVAPVGGGGLVSGLAFTAKTIKPSIKVFAAEPERANDCFLSKRNGYITPLDHTPTTIADGIKSTIGRNTWPIIRDLVDDVITVNEQEIKFATKLVWQRAKFVIEPTAGVGVAAAIKKHTSLYNDGDVKNIAVVLSGGNVDLTTIASVLSDV